MHKQQPEREPLARAFEGHDALNSNVGGRSAAPRGSKWAPIAAKVASAILAAVVLAFIGVKAGAHAEPTLPAVSEKAPTPTPVASATALAEHPSEPPPRSEPALDGGAVHSPGLLPDGRVVLNLASEDELTKLPGIGPSRARAILALRQRLAKFRAVEDLLRVKGIGRKTLRRIKPAAVVDRPSTADAGG